MGVSRHEHTFGSAQLQTVPLKCGHFIKIAHANQTYRHGYWCVKCEAQRWPENQADPEYEMRCLSCSLVRYTGQSRAEAEGFGAKHMLRTGHYYSIDYLSPRRRRRVV